LEEILGFVFYAHFETGEERSFVGLQGALDVGCAFLVEVREVAEEEKGAEVAFLGFGGGKLGEEVRHEEIVQV
jgi:hypothetical protein